MEKIVGTCAAAVLLAACAPASCPALDRRGSAPAVGWVDAASPASSPSPSPSTHPWLPPSLPVQGGESTVPTPSPTQAPTGPGPGRGFAESGPWLTYYGDADTMGDLAAVAARFRIINLDADPGAENFTATQVATLRANGRNRVLSYLNVGAVEDFRSYWSQVPQAGILGSYPGYPDERWMDPANAAWRELLLGTIVPALVAQGVDGFFLDNLEVLSHPTTAATSRQAGLDLIGALRDRYPNMLIVLQNGTGPVTRAGTLTDGRAFAALLDGVSHESVFTQPDDAADAEQEINRIETDGVVLAELRAWRDLGLRPGGRPLLVGISEYVNGYDQAANAARARKLGEAEGFTTIVADRSGGQQEVPPPGF